MTETDRILRPFQYLSFAPLGNVGDQAYGDCPFCGKRNKLYVSLTSGKWDCKSSACGRRGNLSSYIAAWLEDRKGGATADQWAALESDRGIPAEVLQNEGLVWDPDKRAWAIPVRSTTGTPISLRMYRAHAKQKVRGLPGVPVYLFGAEQLAALNRFSEPVYVCEGEWDAIAMRCILYKAGKPGVAIGVPGAGTFKPQWAELFRGRNVVVCYDNDADGRRGSLRVRDLLQSIAASVSTIVWPEEGLPEKCDIRDLWIAEISFSDLSDMIGSFDSVPAPPVGADADTEREPKDAISASTVMASLPPFKSGGRPTLDAVISVYSRHLYMTEGMREALRVIFAVILSNQVDGDPLWVYVAGPPGSGKTELLMSCAASKQTIVRSTLSAHTLVSGFKSSGNKDASLLPLLFGKTFILKDYTEVLRLPAVTKQEIYSTLRGAYDGRVERQFGNNVYREYRGYFSMVAGVTNAIYGDMATSLGERFLVYHVRDSKDTRRDTIMAALQNVGVESRMKEHLEAAAVSFLEYRFDHDDIPSVPRSYMHKIVGLAQLVAMLRATVDFVPGTGFSQERKVMYRPEPEVGTRIAKQLLKLLTGLAMQHDPPRVTDEDYAIVVKTATDSCIGWNLEAIRELAKMDGRTSYEIAAAASVPKNTMRDQLEDMVMLGILRKETAATGGRVGRPAERYWITDDVRQYWKEAGLPLAAPPNLAGVAPPRQRTVSLRKTRASRRRIPRLRGSRQ